MINEQERFSSILHFLGALIFTIGLTLLLPVFVVFLDGETKNGYTTLLAFLLPSFLCMLSGLIVKHKFKHYPPDTRGAMLITIYGWVTACLLGGLPYLIALKVPVVDAFFESVSGLTTTGITVFTGLDNMPKSILFWRALTQWLGGLGILTFFLAITFRGGSASSTIFGAESHKISSTRPVPGMFNSIKILWGIYIAFSITTFIFFMAGGMSLFDSICHMLTCISTGGFSTHDASIGYFAAAGYKHYLFIEYSIIFFMFCGGINFFIHYRVLKGEFRILTRDYEIRWYWFIIISAVIFIMLDHLLKVDSVNGLSAFLSSSSWLAKMHENFRHSLFQVVSILTSTGYSTKDINSSFFPALAKQIILMLMLIGGCVGSTSGGLKVLRVAILNKLVGRELYKIRKIKGAVSPLVVNKKVIPSEELEKIAALFFAWMLFIVAGGGITALFSDLGAWESFSGMVSAVGNMGPMYISGPKMISLNPIIKLTYIVGMLAGRLEILPIIYILKIKKWR
ncbi:TrkH family potassium uptake protein [Thermodesulfobacteriota bacterium]